MHGLALGMPGGPELAVILFVFVAVFGLGKWKSIAKELPGAARLMGSGVRSFKKGLTEEPPEEEAEAPPSVEAPSEPAPDVGASAEESAAAPSAEDSSVPPAAEEA